MAESQDKVKDLYDSYQVGHEFSHEVKRKKYYKFLRSFLKTIPKDIKLFDIGCGAGSLLSFYEERDIEKSNITLVDLSPNNIKFLKERGFNAVCGDILNLELQGNISDVTICTGVIHHIPDPYRAFQELVRITKSGGLIYLSVYNIWNPYFYFVHRLTFPIRYCYWHWSRKFVDKIIYPIVKFFVQTFSFLTIGEFLDQKTCRVFFMDQVITPYAHLFSKSKLRKYAEAQKCHIQKFSFSHHCLMTVAILKKEGK